MCVSRACASNGGTGPMFSEVVVAARFNLIASSLETMEFADSNQIKYEMYK